jgi:hypothetical protein
LTLKADDPPRLRKVRDLEAPPWCYLLWGVPAVMATLATIAYQDLGLPFAAVGSLWIVSVMWAGVGCFLNGRLCGRVHCMIDGILFPALAVLGLLGLLALIPFNWSLFWLVFFGILALSFVPERLWRKYA